MRPARAAAVDPQQVEAVRRFNRFYTRRIGVLQEGLLDTPFSLTEARVLFELGTRGAVTAGELGAVLGLNAGYLSRIVHRLTARRLLARRRSREDRRRVALSLTPSGRAAFRALDRKSAAAARAMLAGLPEAERERLLAAMQETQRVLERDGGAAAERLVLRTHRIGDIGWAIERHGRLYAEEYGWNAAFEALVATLFARFAAGHDPAAERCWIAELDGERVGCVFVARNAEDATVAQLRCLLVEPRARGLGLGRRLVDECIAFARAAGYRKMLLWTNDVLVAARRIYQAAGFTLVAEERHADFGPELVAQTWMRDLR